MTLLVKVVIFLVNWDSFPPPPEPAGGPYRSSSLSSIGVEVKLRIVRGAVSMVVDGEGGLGGWRKQRQRLREAAAARLEVGQAVP